MHGAKVKIVRGIIVDYLHMY